MFKTRCKVDRSHHNNRAHFYNYAKLYSCENLIKQMRPYRIHRLTYNLLLPHPGLTSFQTNTNKLFSTLKQILLIIAITKNREMFDVYSLFLNHINHRLDVRGQAKLLKSHIK